MEVKKKEFSNFTWIDIQFSEKENLSTIAEEYNLDRFQIIDSMQVGHLPKFEKNNNSHFLILRGFNATISDRKTSINEISNKISFFYTDQKIITIHRAVFPFMNELPASAKDCHSFLTLIIKKILGTYAESAKILEEKTEKIEKDTFLKSHQKISLKELYFLKTQTRITKKILQITQNVLQQIEVSASNKSAIQDCKDTVLDLILTYEEILENATNLLHTYMSVNSQRTNEVIKLLTVFSAFFLPLTFIVGLYGMNFEYMPEIKWEYGYYFIIGFMVFTSLLIYYWFKSKKIL